MILCHHSDSVRKSKVEVGPTRLGKWAKREKTQGKNNTGYLNEVPRAGVWVLYYCSQKGSAALSKNVGPFERRPVSNPPLNLSEC